MSQPPHDRIDAIQDEILFRKSQISLNTILISSPTTTDSARDVLALSSEREKALITTLTAERNDLLKNLPLEDLLF